MLEAAQREYSLEALDRKIVFGFFELLADEYVAGLKEYANNTIAWAGKNPGFSPFGGICARVEKGSPRRSLAALEYRGGKGGALENL